MKDPKKLQEILEKYRIDELWINFVAPFDCDHDSYNEEFYLVKNDTGLQDTDDFQRADYAVTCFFAPRFDSDEEDDVASVEITSYFIAGNEKELVNWFAKQKNDLTLLYKRGVGFIG